MAVTLQVVAAVSALAAAVVSLHRWFAPQPVDAGVGRSRTRVMAGAVLMLVAATGWGIVAYQRADERNDQRRDCERILTEMQSTLSSALADEGGVGFGSPSRETDWTMQDRASDLDAEVAQQDSGIFVSYVVTKRGEVLGTIDNDGIDENRCQAFASQRRR
jgi:hypothetical protein